MDPTLSKKPMNMVELLPEISVILSEDAIISLTAQKKPRPTIAQKKAFTAEKVFKPMTIAEMWNDVKALHVKSPKKDNQPTASAKKRWNSSVKLDKRQSIKGTGKIQTSTVRKVLDFQTKPKVPNSRPTTHFETPKFPKPEYRAKKPVLKSTQNTVRISGICNIPETPVAISKPIKSRMTLANKENVKSLVPIPRTYVMPPPPSLTPLSNDVCDSTCDSFLQNEIKANDDEQKKNIVEMKINNVTPNVSTPFKQHRNVQEFFDDAITLDDSAVYKDNTIMSFSKPSSSNTHKREESVIVSLCDLLNKATVTDIEEANTLDDLLKLEKQIEQNSQTIDNTIKMLNELRQSENKSLKLIRQLIKEKKAYIPRNNDKSEQVTKVECKVVKPEEVNTNSTPIISKPCSVIKSCLKTPVYKIPKKSPCLKKIVFCKSMPTQHELESPTKDISKRALNMYMEMKEHMNFLKTPSKRPQKTAEPDTPTVTSHNLQLQLERLYGES